MIDDHNNPFVGTNTNQKKVGGLNCHVPTKTYNPNQIVITSEWFGFTFILDEF